MKTYYLLVQKEFMCVAVLSVYEKKEEAESVKEKFERLCTANRAFFTTFEIIEIPFSASVNDILSEAMKKATELSDEN